MQSGLYADLSDSSRLIKHTEVKTIPNLPPSPDYYKLLLPEQLPFISYSYEWSFSQLRDAALLTLSVQKTALEHGQTMKDASAYNVQFLRGCPILIDTLSFEVYNSQPVWMAYRQFCQHFLAPLALMAQVDLTLNLLLRDFIDGLPLDMTAKMLPTRARLKTGQLFHLIMHGASIRRGASSEASQYKSVNASVSSSNLSKLLGLVESLERAIKNLKLPSKLKTTWGDYYNITNYSSQALERKKTLVASYVSKLKPPMVWDLGGNDGTFSRVALAAGASQAICFDIDPLAVERNYLQLASEVGTKLLPLRLDLTNPSPGLGWSGRERSSLTSRANSSNLVLALALVHHLAIANNLPFSMLAEYFSTLGDHLIIEFIPKSDSKVQFLLKSRRDIFNNYDHEHFEQAFAQFYETLQSDTIPDSSRTLYLMRRRPDHA